MANSLFLTVNKVCGKLKLETSSNYRHFAMIIIDLACISCKLIAFYDWNADILCC